MQRAWALRHFHNYRYQQASWAWLLVADAGTELLKPLLLIGETFLYPSCAEGMVMLLFVRCAEESAFDSWGTLPPNILLDRSSTIKYRY